jgi:hypothetical protein
VTAVLASVLAFAAGIAFASDGSTTWYSTTLRPHERARLACPPQTRPAGSDAAVLGPYGLTRRTWLDGGEVLAFTRRGRVVATATPSQGPRGMGDLLFASRARTVSVEILCDR